MNLRRLLLCWIWLAALSPAAPAQDAELAEDAVPLPPVTARPPEDAFTAADRQLRDVLDGLPDFGPAAPPPPPGAVEGLLRWALLPSVPEPVSDAAALSAEEHLRNAGRSREQLP